MVKQVSLSLFFLRFLPPVQYGSEMWKRVYYGAGGYLCGSVLRDMCGK